MLFETLVRRRYFHKRDPMAYFQIASRLIRPVPESWGLVYLDPWLRSLEMALASWFELERRPGQPRLSNGAKKSGCCHVDATGLWKCSRIDVGNRDTWPVPACGTEAC